MRAARGPGRYYTREWRDRIRDGAQSSANVLAEHLCHVFAPRTVADFGCGEGWLVEAFRQRGVKAVGVDGDWAHTGHGPGPDIDADLTDPAVELELTADLAVSLEVGEHLPEARATALVAMLCSSAPAVAFSAAVPGQGGVGHVNEQWPAYWAARFVGQGYQVTGALRWRLWDEPDLEPWYAQNLLLAVAGSQPMPLGLEPDGCPAVIHPGVWAVYR